MDDGMGTRGKTWMMAWGPPGEDMDDGMGTRGKTWMMAWGPEGRHG